MYFLFDFTLVLCSSLDQSRCLSFFIIFWRGSTEDHRCFVLPFEIKVDFTEGLFWCGFLLMLLMSASLPCLKLCVFDLFPNDSLPTIIFAMIPLEEALFCIRTIKTATL